MTELYIRDLNDIAKKELITWLLNHSRHDLVEAHKNGKDVIVGESFDDSRDCKLA